MTDEHTTQLDPATIDMLDGPALAEAVAVRVMGWKRPIKSQWWYSENGDIVNEYFIYRPDLNIVQAWWAMEEMQPKGWTYVELFVKRGGAHCVCAFERMVRGNELIRESGWGTTAPLAICRAALKAATADRKGTASQDGL